MFYSAESPMSVRRSTQISRRLAWVSALGLCGFCSCTTLNGPTAASAVPPPRPVAPQVAGHARLPSAPVMPAPQMTAAPVMPRRPVASQIRQVSNEQAFASSTDRAIERVAAESRTPAALCPDPYGVGLAYNDDGASPVANPDEYLFDGGDRSYPITRDLDQFRGLETEDTIAQYKDEDGNLKIRKSNRVAIYAPRFGSVVSISGPSADTLVDKVHGHVVAQGGVNLRGRTVTGTREQRLEMGRIQTHSRATGIGTDVSTDTLYRGQHRGVEVAVINTHESHAGVGGEMLHDKLTPIQMKGMQFAEIWTRKQNPVIEGHATASSQSVTVQAQASFTGLEDFGKRGDLRLIKTADKGEAEIGDVITFTLIYENRGDRELKQVSILDNLTPRLEYVANSTTTDRPAKVEAEDNGEGSVLLKFVLDEPLPGKTKGTITFKARVR